MTRNTENAPPKLSRVYRLDSSPVNSTYFTEEGYLIDHPILTSIGIFEYTNPDEQLAENCEFLKRFLSLKASSPIRESLSS